MTFKLSARSRDKLSGVDERMAAVVTSAIHRTKIDFGVICGLRTIEEQRELVKSGASQTMKSKHIDGLAVDLMAYVGPRGSWELNLYDDIADAMAEAAREVDVPIRWGAAWDCAKYSTVGWHDGGRDERLYRHASRAGQTPVYRRPALRADGLTQHRLNAVIHSLPRKLGGLDAYSSAAWRGAQYKQSYIQSHIRKYLRIAIDACEHVARFAPAISARLDGRLHLHGQQLTVGRLHPQVVVLHVYPMAAYPALLKLGGDEKLASTSDVDAVGHARNILHLNDFI